MSFNPAPIAQSVQASRTWSTFVTRVQLARVSPTTYTTAGFTVPSVGGTVSVPVSAGSAFAANDLVAVGTRVTVLQAPVHATTGPGSLTFSGVLPGSLQAGNNVTPTGHRLVSVANPTSRTTDTTSGGWAVPNYQQSSTVSVTCADRSAIPSGGAVLVTNYAGVFEVVAAFAASLTLRLVRAGDLLAGETCIQETSYSYTGAPVSQGYPLTALEPQPYRAFFPVDASVVSISRSNPSATTAAVSIGYSAGADTGRARFGDWAQGKAVQSGSVLTVGCVVPLTTNVGVLDNQRIAVPWGHTLWAAVTTASGTAPTTDATVALCVRGYWSEG